MQRRSLFKGLASLLYLPMLKAPAAPTQQPTQQPLLQDLIISDSDGNSTAALNVLKDGNTRSGGISYGA